MTKKLLIANRGEIACRVIKTAKLLGWKTVAVYSSADKHSLHVSLADEAYLIGDPPPTESYLNQEAILKVAIENNVSAIHPGYGFLSENPVFSAKCSELDIVFVGPPAKSVEVMGLKGIARQCMEDAGVPVLPGINKITSKTTNGEISALGYPVLIKPEAGGGGKGMKIVHDESELDAALSSARREAQSAFGNDSLMVEKYLIKPRHIEIQVFADNHGHCIHLNERDCSLQRRHQKIVEESPAPLFSGQLRLKMGTAAIAAAKAVEYVGAGTVEFLLASDDQFYFMEMNTRLQVEHPVTELVTKLDLVEWQLRIALGEPLPLNQDDINISGHAMEVRIYAEDPANDFLPVSGEITHLKLPHSDLDNKLTSLRVDNGIQLGDQVGVYYDPMLMKLIALAPSRDLCIAQLSEGISELEIAGIRTNRDFLNQLISHQPFIKGSLGTDYLDNNLHKVLIPRTQEEKLIDLSAVCVYLLYKNAQASPWSTQIGFRLNQETCTKIEIESDSEQIILDIKICDSQIRVNQTCLNQVILSTNCRFVSLSNSGTLVIDIDQQRHRFRIQENNERITIFGIKHTGYFSLPNETFSLNEEEGNIAAPMSGKIVEILVSVGDLVKKGSPLAILEAMKMEHTIVAPTEGIVEELHFSAGDLVNEGVPILDLSAEPQNL